MGHAKTQEEWTERTRGYLKGKIQEAEITYDELARRLRKHGFKETRASITNKLARGTFTATFLLATLAALELEGVMLVEIV